MVTIYIEEEKAKYIQEKERTLFNDLKKVNKKLYQINNWYSISNYKPTSEDQENMKILIQHTNNIYYILKQLLFNTKNNKLVEDLPQIITDERLDSLKELEEKILDIKNNKTNQLTDET